MFDTRRNNIKKIEIKKKPWKRRQNLLHEFKKSLKDRKSCK